MRVDMNVDLDFLGIFVPPLIVAGVVSFVFWMVIKKNLAAFGLYEFIVFRNLYDVSLYFLILAGIVYFFGGATIEPIF